MRSDQLVAEIPFIRLDGTGVMNLVDETLDFDLKAAVAGTPTFDDGTTIDDLNGLAIPLTVKGPMTDPSVRVDIRKLAAGAVTKKLKDRLLDRLGLDEPEPDGAATGNTAAPPPAEKPRDALKRSLRDLLKPQ
jgi:AsmA protein